MSHLKEVLDARCSVTVYDTFEHFWNIDTYDELSGCPQCSWKEC